MKIRSNFMRLLTYDWSTHYKPISNLPGYPYSFAMSYNHADSNDTSPNSSYQKGYTFVPPSDNYGNNYNDSPRKFAYTTKAEAEDESSNKLKIVLLSGGILTLALIGGAGIYLWRSRPSSSSENDKGNFSKSGSISSVSRSASRSASLSASRSASASNLSKSTSQRLQRPQVNSAPNTHQQQPVQTQKSDPARKVSRLSRGQGNMPSSSFFISTTACKGKGYHTVTILGRNVPLAKEKISNEIVQILLDSGMKTDDFSMYKKMGDFAVFIVDDDGRIRCFVNGTDMSARFFSGQPRNLVNEAAILESTSTNDTIMIFDGGICDFSDPATAVSMSLDKYVELILN